MSHNRAPIVCLVVLALTASAFIATQLTSGQASQTDKKPLKMKVLRDKAHVKYSPGQLEIAAFRRTLPQENERQLVSLVPKHVPIKIKIKKEKEAGFKDLNNEKWGWEFELEVTNTGTKPIYSLYFLVMTDVIAASGSRVIFPLYYGRDELGDIRTKAEPTDVPIKPGESVSLDIHPGILNAWDYYRKKQNRPFPKHLEVKFQFLSFGDGTGYVGSDATPLPRAIPEEGGSAACLAPFQTDAFGWNEAPPGSPLSKLLAFNLPDQTWPVNFLRGSAFETNTSSASLFDTCCPGVNCSMLSRSIERTCVNCPPQTRVGLAICSNPDAACLTATFGSFVCFSPNPDGCPFGYQLSNGACCVPIACPQPTPTPPSCGESEASIFSASPICAWSDCFTLLPNPSPTPTPASGSVEYKRDCEEYYWVEFVSYDGGKTWQPTGHIEYAGCLYV